MSIFSHNNNNNLFNDKNSFINEKIINLSISGNKKIEIISYKELLNDIYLPGEIIIKTNQPLKIKISFPLKNPCIFTIFPNSEKGFTRAFLINEICRIYNEIYKKEEESASFQTIVLDVPCKGCNDNEKGCKKLCNGYKTKAFHVKVLPEELKSLYVISHRNITNGTYGIHSHYLSDLYLDFISYFEESGIIEPRISTKPISVFILCNNK